MLQMMLSRTLVWLKANIFHTEMAWGVLCPDYKWLRIARYNLSMTLLIRYAVICLLWFVYDFDTLHIRLTNPTFSTLHNHRHNVLYGRSSSIWVADEHCKQDSSWWGLCTLSLCRPDNRPYLSTIRSCFESSDTTSWYVSITMAGGWGMSRTTPEFKRFLGV